MDALYTALVIFHPLSSFFLLSSGGFNRRLLCKYAPYLKYHLLLQLDWTAPMTGFDTRFRLTVLRWCGQLSRKNFNQHLIFLLQVKWTKNYYYFYYFSYLYTQGCDFARIHHDPTTPLNSLLLIQTVILTAALQREFQGEFHVNLIEGSGIRGLWRYFPPLLVIWFIPFSTEG